METLATRFRAILSGLQAVIATVAAKAPARIPFFVYLWGRIARTATRLDRLHARFQAGTLPKPRKPRPGRITERRETPKIPTSRAWLVADIGWQAAGCGAQLQHLLDTPDLAAFLAAAPQARRLLRPLAHMLGATLPGHPPPPTPKPSRPKPTPAQTAWPPTWTAPPEPRLRRNITIMPPRIFRPV
jgi:hypothetical protein